MHKVILGLSLHTLKEEIAACDDIDKTDSFGNTALFWAARRNNMAAVKLLLEANANPNVLNQGLNSPLLCAAALPDFVCCRVLLEAGAKPTARNHFGQTALHFVAQHESRRQAVRELILAGADPNVKDSHGTTPLFNAAYHNCVVPAETLLDHGADINILDNEGDCALFQSIFCHSDEVTQLLLSRKAIYVTVGSDGTILHVAARSGGVRTIEILLVAELKGIDTDALNPEGKTALQMAEERDQKEPGFILKFRELLSDIRSRNAQASTENPERNTTTSSDTNRHQIHSHNWLKWIRQINWRHNLILSWVRYIQDAFRRILRWLLHVNLPVYCIVLLYLLGIAGAFLISRVSRAKPDFGVWWQVIVPGALDEL